MTSQRSKKGKNQFPVAVRACLENSEESRTFELYTLALIEHVNLAPDHLTKKQPMRVLVSSQAQLYNWKIMLSGSRILTVFSDWVLFADSFALSVYMMNIYNLCIFALAILPNGEYFTFYFICL